MKTGRQYGKIFTRNPLSLDCPLKATTKCFVAGTASQQASGESGGEVCRKKILR